MRAPRRVVVVQYGWRVEMMTDSTMVAEWSRWNKRYDRQADSPHGGSSIRIGVT
jgi:hypothetical protein